MDDSVFVALIGSGGMIAASLTAWVATIRRGGSAPVSRPAPEPTQRVTVGYAEILGGQPYVEPEDTFWFDVVGIPIDEWMTAFPYGMPADLDRFHDLQRMRDDGDFLSRPEPVVVEHEPVELDDEEFRHKWIKQPDLDKEFNDRFDEAIQEQVEYWRSKAREHRPQPYQFITPIGAREPVEIATSHVVELPYRDMSYAALAVLAREAYPSPRVNIDAMNREQLVYLLEARPETTGELVYMMAEPATGRTDNVHPQPARPLLGWGKHWDCGHSDPKGKYQ